MTNICIETSRFGTYQNQAKTIDDRSKTNVMPAFTKDTRKHEFSDFTDEHMNRIARGDNEIDDTLSLSNITREIKQPTPSKKVSP